MNIYQYMHLSARTDVNYPGKYREDTKQVELRDKLMHACLGLTTETAEIADQIKKSYFYGKEIDKINLVEELGDVMWYWALACRALNVNPEEVLNINIEKLRKRYPEGFDTEKYANRDLDAEHAILEKTHFMGESKDA